MTRQLAYIANRLSSQTQVHVTLVSSTKLHSTANQCYVKNPGLNCSTLISFRTRVVQNANVRM